MKLEAWSLALFGAAAMLAFAGSAGAVDGTIEINQAKVLAGSGFPYAISASGSYRLTGNLTVPASTNGISVTANNVTIDMNGFSITGPGSTSGVVNGIDATGNGVTVENGTVTGFGLGVVLGNSDIVRNVHADANGFGGMDVGDNTLVEGCTANNSTVDYGIACGAGCAISGNTANGNGGNGIFCTGGGCTISGNTANGNLGTGILCQDSGCVISGNTLIGNPTLGIGCFTSGCLITGNTILNSTNGIEASDSTTGYGGNVLKDTTPFSSGTSLGAKNTNLCTTSGVTSAC